MRAIRIHTYGGPEVLSYEDAPDPRLGDDDVLVRVHAAGVNPVDGKMREGRAGASRPARPLPFIPGWDVSGVVVARGQSVTRFTVGDEVFGRPDLARDGAYAELLAVRATELSRKPESLDHVMAAAVPLAGLTALQCLFEAGQGFQGAALRAGETVLVHAAAGGVGGYAVQLAKWKGARVVATCSERNTEYVRSLGADEVIDYTRVRFEEVVHDVDVVLATVAGDTLDRSWKTLRKGGILVSIVGHPDQEVAAQHGVRAGYVFVQPSPIQLDQLAELLDAGTLRVEISGVLPLSSARQAHELMQEGHVRGKLVLNVEGSG